eukprot:1629042-Ditylum_brightwellii.AAC.1
MPSYMLYCIHVLWYTYFNSTMTNNPAILPSLSALLNKLCSHCIILPPLPCSLLQAQENLHQHQPATMPTPALTPTPTQPQAPAPQQRYQQNHGQFAPGKDCRQCITNTNM